jgi:2'-deoxynucleoside 5'-phosphate N-hydrolase
VGGQAYIAIKYHPDQRNRNRIEHITRALARIGLDSVCTVRDVEAWGQVSLDARTLMQVSFNAIDASELVIVDLTEKGVGIGIEAGYAYARGVPIVTVAEAGADISTTLEGISRSVSFYRDAEELGQAVSAAWGLLRRGP